MHAAPRTSPPAPAPSATTGDAPHNSRNETMSVGSPDPAPSGAAEAQRPSAPDRDAGHRHRCSLRSRPRPDTPAAPQAHALDDAPSKPGAPRPHIPPTGASAQPARQPATPTTDRVAGDVATGRLAGNMPAMKVVEAWLANTLCHTTETSRNRHSIGVKAHSHVSPVLLPQAS